jgi:methylenetetrahydrofolate dehydrogenase (NADP+)/methenyltetrahydrofolate cyclohydrolase
MIPLLSKCIVKSLNSNIAADVAQLQKKGIKPRMIAVVSSSDPSVLSYIVSKQKSSTKNGIIFDIYDVSNIIEIDRAVDRIHELCSDKTVHGLVVELPVKTGWDDFTLLNAIYHDKDIDGLSAYNLGILSQGNLANITVAPATPEACILMAESVSPIKGKNVVVVGRGKTVGKPLANMLINIGATVTVCNSNTVDLQSFTKAADIVFLATGLGHNFNRRYFREGQIIVDAGISSKNGRIVGDADIVDLDTYNVKLTPVPGGVGPLTSVLILRNLINLVKKANG